LCLHPMIVCNMLDIIAIFQCVIDCVYICDLISGAYEWWEDREGNASSPFEYRASPRGCNWVSGTWSKDKWMLMDWAASTNLPEASGILDAAINSLFNWTVLVIKKWNWA